MLYTLRNDRLNITIDDFGAQMISLKLDGAEKLWQNPTNTWTGHAPLLFPVCGNCQVWVEGVQYPITSHGFAKRMPFECVCQKQDQITFQLCSNSQTLALYPFHFDFSVTYQICQNTLFVTYDVTNKGTNVMYFSCGGHESFALQGNFEHYSIQFEKEEKLLGLLHDEQTGQLNGQTIDYGVGKKYVFDKPSFENGKTVIFANVNSRKLTFCHKDTPIAELQFDGFGNLLLWAPLSYLGVCIEPWINLPDLPSEAQTELSQKKNFVELQPLQSKKLVRSIKYLI